MRNNISKLALVATFGLFSCTTVERDNCWDSKGINYRCQLSSSSSLLSSSSSVGSSVPSGCSNVGSYSCDMSGYRTVKIGSQTWMAENLNCDVEGSRCYGDKTENCDKYGRLYDWCTAMAVCPEGWHLPSDGEWQELIDLAGGLDIAGWYLKAEDGWIDGYGDPGNGEDKFGFSALPGGCGGCGYDYNSGFGSGGICGHWWSFGYGDSVIAWYLEMDADSDGINSEDNEEDYYLYDTKGMMFSVRCLQD